MTAPRDLVLRFLASIGRPNEAEQYLELFRASPAFAIVHVSDAVVRDAADVLAVDLRLLANLGLRPVLAFGAADAASPHGSTTRGGAADAASPHGSTTRGGAADAASPHGSTTRGGAADAASPHGSTTRGGAAPSGDDGGGAAHARAIREVLDVPSAIATAPAAVAAALANDVLPLCPLGAPTVDARFAELGALAAALGSRKLVFLGRRSGLQPDGGAVISIVDLALPLPAGLPPQQAALLAQLPALVDRIPHRATISITSPLDLLRELFTVKGAGTLVRRGARVARFAAWAELDTARLYALIEEAFGRALIADLRARALAAAYVADDYRGAAIVTDTPLAPYLSKFAVTTVARGEGVGGDLWRALAPDHPRLFWRSRAANPIAAWYREQADGLVRVAIDGAPWMVFWRGLAPAEIPDAIAYCLASPPDFD